MSAAQSEFLFNALDHRRGRDLDAVTVGKKQLRVTPVFAAYWYFAAERQRIFFRRLNGVSDALTSDSVLQSFKFTNTYRASDRVSQYLIRHVIYRDDLPDDPTILVENLLFHCSYERADFTDKAVKGNGTPFVKDRSARIIALASSCSSEVADSSSIV